MIVTMLPVQADGLPRKQTCFDVGLAPSDSPKLAWHSAWNRKCSNISVEVLLHK